MRDSEAEIDEILDSYQAELELKPAPIKRRLPQPRPRDVNQLLPAGKRKCPSSTVISTDIPSNKKKAVEVNVNEKIPSSSALSSFYSDIDFMSIAKPCIGRSSSKDFTPIAGPSSGPSSSNDFTPIAGPSSGRSSSNGFMARAGPGNYCSSSNDVNCYDEGMVQTQSVSMSDISQPMFGPRPVGQGENTFLNNVQFVRMFPGPAGLWPLTEEYQPPYKHPIDSYLDLPKVNFFAHSNVTDDPDVEATSGAKALVYPHYTRTPPHISFSGTFDGTEAPWQQLLLDYNLEDPLNPLKVYTIAWITRRIVKQQLSDKKAPFLAAVFRFVELSKSAASVSLQDATGVMSGTLHQEVLQAYGRMIMAGTAIVLHRLGVVTTKGSMRNPVLNITLRNVIAIYSSEVDNRRGKVHVLQVQNITKDQIQSCAKLWERQALHSIPPSIPVSVTSADTDGAHASKAKPPDTVVHTSAAKTSSFGNAKTLEMPFEGTSTITSRVRQKVGADSSKITPFVPKFKLSNQFDGRKKNWPPRTPQKTIPEEEEYKTTPFISRKTVPEPFKDIEIVSKDKDVRGNIGTVSAKIMPFAPTFHMPEPFPGGSDKTELDSSQVEVVKAVLDPRSSMTRPVPGHFQPKKPRLAKVPTAIGERNGWRNVRTNSEIGPFAPTCKIPVPFPALAESNSEIGPFVPTCKIPKPFPALAESSRVDVFKELGEALANKQAVPTEDNVEPKKSRFAEVPTTIGERKEVRRNIGTKKCEIAPFVSACKIPKPFPAGAESSPVDVALPSKQVEPKNVRLPHVSAPPAKKIEPAGNGKTENAFHDYLEGFDVTTFFEEF